MHKIGLEVWAWLSICKVVTSESQWCGLVVEDGTSGCHLQSESYLCHWWCDNMITSVIVTVFCQMVPRVGWVSSWEGKVESSIVRIKQRNTEWVDIASLHISLGYSTSAVLFDFHSPAVKNVFEHLEHYQQHFGFVWTPAHVVDARNQWEWTTTT